MNSIKFSAAVCSDKGRIRNNNEDNFYFNGTHLNPKNRDDSNFFSDNPGGSEIMYGVFDGMGGEAFGEEASLITAQTVKKYHAKLKNGEIKNNKSAILKSISDANTKICNKIVETGERRIGTTFALLSIFDDTAQVYNIGDSRVYLYRNKKLTQISVDDTTAQRLVNMGVITKEKAKTHEDRHKLTQHLGIFNDEMIVEPHISEKIMIEKGDKFILCSDGLTDMVENEEIRSIMQKAGDSRTAAKKLVEAALRNGGRDNVTVTVVSADTKSLKKRQRGSKNKLAVGAAVLALAVAVLGFAIGKNASKPKEIKYIAATKITLDEGNYKKVLNVGETASPMPQRFPVVDKDNNETGLKEFHYESSDTSIVEVNDKNQCYTGLKPGKATITVSMDNASCTVEIEVVRPIEEITAEDVKLKKGESRMLSYKLLPDGTKGEVVFSSSDNEIAAIGSNGEITAVSKGTANITISVGEISKTIKVTVTDSENNPGSEIKDKLKITDKSEEADKPDIADKSDAAQHSEEKIPIEKSTDKEKDIDKQNRTEDEPEEGKKESGKQDNDKQNNDSKINNENE